MQHKPLIITWQLDYVADSRQHHHLPPNASKTSTQHNVMSSAWQLQQLLLVFTNRQLFAR
jgi:hypothetical protein